MKRFIIGIGLLVAAAQGALSATVVNMDSEVRTLIVTEGGDKTELSLGAGETQQFCTGGCFVTMPNGDREALSGGETIEISGGAARIK
jgi:hypothetical protein